MLRQPASPTRSGLGRAEILTGNTPVGSAILDQSLVIIRSCASFQELLQRSEAEINGRSVTELFPSEELAEQLLAVVHGRDTTRSRRFVLTRPDGTICPLRVSAATTHIGREEPDPAARLILFIEDLTEEERLRELAQAAQARLTQLVAMSPAVFYAVSPDANGVMFVSGNVTAQTGYQARDFIENPSFWAERIHPDDRQRVFAEKSTLGEHGRSSVEYRLLHKDGTYRWMLDESQLVRAATGEPIEIVGSAFDITERKRAEQIRREDEERYRTLFDNAPIGLGVTDTQGTLLAFNRAMMAPGGYTIDDTARMRTVGNLYANQDDRARVLKILDERGFVDREEVEFKRKDGSRYTSLLTLRPVLMAGQPCVLAMSEDISDRKSLEAQMRAAQKMEALGRLAGGVAHDFNNLLMVIIGYAGFVRDELRRGDPRRDDIAEVLRAADSAASLTQHLLVFSRRMQVKPRAVALDHLILDLDKMLRRLIGEDIELVVLPGADLQRVRVDPRQMEQVVVNLAVNARDAMPTGGTLTLALDNVVVTEADLAEGPLLPAGEYVRLLVKDTGCGMDATTQEQIFEPFFTTKEEGKGTGLGLATCYGIIKQFDGHVAVESRVGQGTTFKIYFPRFARAADPPEESLVALAGPHGSETVLVVEDQRAVRELAVRALAACGYRMLEAENGEAALAVIREQNAPIHLLLSDVVMPQMSGTELARHFRAIFPRAKVLLMSGYTDEEANRHGVLESGHALLQKPFMPDTLMLRVREVLDGAELARDLA